MVVKTYSVGPVTGRSMPFWCIGNPLSDPFGRAVLPAIDSLETARLVAWACEKGLIEFTGAHDDDLVQWDPNNLEDDLDENSPAYAKLTAIKEILDAAGVGFHTMTCNLHSHLMFRRGGLTNSDENIRALAKAKVRRALRIGQLLGAVSFTYWVARDGWEVAVTIPAQTMAWLKDGLDDVTDYMQAKKMTNYMRATIEPKPNEPRGHMYLPTAGHAAAFTACLKNPQFWGVNPELLQHESMALLDAVTCVMNLVHLGKLSFLHFGNQIKGQFDNDSPPLVGPEGLKETAAMFAMLTKLGWKGVVEFDCHMLRTEGDPENPIDCRKQFIENCVDALSMALIMASRLEPLECNGLSDSQVDLLATMRMCGISREEVAVISGHRKAE